MSVTGHCASSFPLFSATVVVCFGVQEQFGVAFFNYWLQLQKDTQILKDI